MTQIHVLPDTPRKSIKPKSGDEIIFGAGVHAPLQLGGLVGVNFLAAAGAVLRGLALHGCKDFSLSGLRVEGDFVVGQNRTTGITIRESSGGRVSGCDISKTFHGISHTDSTGIQIVENRLHDLFGDAIRGNSSDVLIEDNFVTDMFHDPKMHADVVQFWTNAGDRIRNVRILGNVFRKGRGIVMQGIWLGNEAVEAPFEGVVIEGNVIDGAQDNGIGVTWSTAPVIRDNLVTVYEGDKGPAGRQVKGRILLKKAVDAVVEGNISAGVNAPESTGIREARNIRIVPLKPGDSSLVERWLQERLPLAGVSPEALEKARGILAQFKAGTLGDRGTLTQLKALLS